MVWFHREYNFMYWLSRSVIKLLFILFSRPTIVGLENVPKTGGILLVSNHESHLDPPLIGTTTPRKVHFLAKAELFGGLLGWFMKNIGQIKVERGKGGGAVDIAVDLLKNGKCLAIFPEGTRSRTGEMQKPHTGVVVIASKAECPILPIHIDGTFEIMRPKTKFPKLFRKIRIVYGKPFNLTVDDLVLGNKEHMRNTADSIMERIKALTEI